MPDDFAASILTTGAVTVGGSATGDIGTSRDVDWFAVEFVAGRTYVIDLEGAAAGGGTLGATMLLGVFDDAGGRASRKSRDGGDPRLVFTATETGTHFVAVRGGGRDDTGTYTLRVRDQDPPPPGNAPQVQPDPAAQEPTLMMQTLTGISRRSFLKSGSALWVATGVGALPAQAQAVKGGRLIVGMTGGGVSDTLDPRTFTSSGHACVGFTIGNCLTEIERDSELVGELAESWESSADGKDWRFNLRRGVTFHNGKEMTSADVVWSLNLHRGEGSTSGAAGLTGDISDIVADGPHAINVKLSRANADLPYLLGDFHMLIVAEGTEDFTAGAFTGPYQVVEYNPGESVIATRNPNYWKAGRAHVDDVEILFVEDRNARINGIVTGELHMAQQIDEQAMQLIDQTPGVHIESHPSGGHSPILMHCDKAPFDNADLRLAVKLAVDRQQVLGLLQGGVLGNDHPIPPHDPFHAGDIPQRMYDPERAAFHLERSGFDGSLPLSINNVAMAKSEEFAASFQQSAAKAGLRIDIVREPSEGFWSEVWRKKPFMIGAWGGRPTADIMLTTAYHSSAAWNDSMWRRPEFDQLIDQARGETDFESRRQLYHDAQLLIHEDGGSCITFFRNNIDGVRDEVKGFYPAGSFNMSGLRAVERVWLEG